MRILSRSVAALLLFIAVAGISGEAFAQGGGLMVNPKRVVLEGNKRTDVLTLFNNSDDTTVYSISLKHYRMEENGSFQDIDTIPTTDLFCDSIIRYFPAEVTLPPHGSQIVRVRYLKPKDLAPGEYRSHMYFRSIERAQALETAPVDPNSKSVTLQLHAIFGLAVPIIVRNETQPATVSMNNFQIKADTGGYYLASADVSRSGNESCYGSLVLTYKSPSGSESELGLMKGIAVYVPLAKRQIVMRFKAPDGVDMSSGTLRMEYQTLTDNPKETMLAYAETPAHK